MPMMECEAVWYLECFSKNWQVSFLNSKHRLLYQPNSTYSTHDLIFLQEKF